MRARKNGYSGRPVGLRDQLLPEEEDEDEEPYWLEFLLVYGDGEITSDNTEVLVFINRDEFVFTDGQGSSSFGRVPTGALERWGYMGSAAEAAE